MADDEIKDAGMGWSILENRVTMDVIPREEGDLRVRFRDDDDEVLWSSVFDRGFWESRTKKGEIGNKLADNTSFAKSTVKEELETVWTDLTENANEYEGDLIPPAVEQLIQNTQTVEVYGGEETERHVYVEAQPFGDYVGPDQTDGGASVRKLVFSNEEWVKSNGDTQTPPVVEKYSNAFYETLEITWEEWRADIRPHWKDMQEIVSDDQMSTADRIAMSVVRSLRHRLDVHADAQKILNDAWNGWYEEDSAYGEVVWVPGDTLDEALDKHDKGTEYRSALSRALKGEGYTLGNRRQTTIQGDPVELYPFIPTTVGVEDPDVDIIGLEDDDDDGEETDAGEDDSNDDDEVSEDDKRIDDVVDVVDDLDPECKGVPENEVIAEASTKRDLGPPGDIRDAIERGVLSGVLYRPGDEEQELVAVRPGGTETPGEDDIDPNEDGVPEP
ncbi:hypothetical protein [Natronoarchaeum rubrum]|uniref:hypothetical protein n=1 Tax=Natronoarchaeum rubrum TaxID=755311 RepID=UPI0021130220|nr:hypothetical protein [Natronoarchaeum rubrum]